MNEEKSIEGTSTIIWCKLRAKVFMYDHNTKNSMQFAYNIPYIMREWAKILRNSSQYKKKFICESYNMYNVHVPFCFFNIFFFVQIHFSCAILKICGIHFQFTTKKQVIIPQFWGTESLSVRNWLLHSIIMWFCGIIKSDLACFSMVHH